MNDAKPTCGWNESAPSFPGKDCQCEAHSESECGFDADWTPSEVYKLRKERDEAREDARLLAERLTRLELDSSLALAKLERERTELKKALEGAK